MKINPKFKSLIPPLSAEEYAQLESNLIKEGCRDALVAWRGVLVDGHNRLEICERNGLKFRESDREFKDENEAMAWIIRNQFGRRNLSLYDRSVLALKLEPLIREKARENQKAGGAKSDGAGKVVRQKSDKPLDTKKEIAAIAHVSHDTIAKVKKIEAKASEETKAAIRSGATTINAEYKKLTVHVGHNSGENEWYSPARFVEAARAAMGSIDCDPASSEMANKTVKAKKFFTKENDGLKQKWSGNVWMNPPYAQPLMGKFAAAVAEKFCADEIKQACVLVNNATETEWFGVMAKWAGAICFPSTRVKFLDPQGRPGAPLQGQAVIYLGKRVAEFCSAFDGFGFCCHVVH